MASFMIEAKCPEHAIERYKIKIIKKYNISQQKIMPKFRTRPKYELSGIIIGKNISYEAAKDYVVHYLNESSRLNMIMSVRLMK